jgi:hypothetical protein
MAVIVKTDKAKWTQVMDHAQGIAAYALAEQILQDSEQFVPFSGGSSQSAGGLRESGKVVEGEATGEFYIVYDSVYALYQWFGVRADGSHPVHHYTTPGTGKQWVETAKAAFGARWQEIAQKRFTEELK